MITVRIRVNDGGKYAMIRAALMLEGIVCGESGSILVTDSLSGISLDGEITGVVLLSDAVITAENGKINVPLSVLYSPICFEDIISEVRRLDEVSAEAPDISDVPAENEDGIVCIGGLVSYRGKSTQLTERELLLFEYLRRNNGQTVSRRKLLSDVWGQERGDTNVTDVYVSYLRRKLKPLFGEGVLLTVRGKGYILNLPSD